MKLSNIEGEMRTYTKKKNSNKAFLFCKKKKKNVHLYKPPSTCTVEGAREGQTLRAMLHHSIIT